MATGSPPWRFCPTAAAPSPAPGTRPSSSGTWRAATSCAPSKVMRFGHRRGAPARRPPRPLRLMRQDLKLWDLESGAVLRTFEGHAVGHRRGAAARRPPRPLRLRGRHPQALGSGKRRPSCAPSKAIAIRSPPWRCCPTAAAPSPAPRTTPSSSGIWRAGPSCAPSRATAIRSPPSRSARRPPRPLRLWDNTLKLWDLENGTAPHPSGPCRLGHRPGAAAGRPRSLRLLIERSALGSGQRSVPRTFGPSRSGSSPRAQPRASPAPRTATSSGSGISTSGA